ncbi:MAG: LpxL/LpxP family Kdo(2)-lipid IV(A) lauroyl/palmitoleoyl acyltransferase [Pseudomonadales bacterium]|nr:LpxL/LpxP family Kdo(2)-lipid IV(A) lauroyl/palmitoleoyl acyltransferase [Pseudomonadales bacterium]
MRSKATQFKTALLHPRYGLTWFGFGLWRLVTLLPYSVLLVLGRAIGLVFYAIPSRRKTIAGRNIELCFPDLSIPQQRAMLRANFISTGIAVMEVGISWWWSKKRFNKLIHIEGQEHLDAVKGRGVMLLGIHFTTLEIGAAAVSTVIEMDGMYRAHGNPVYDFLQARGRLDKGIGDGVVFERRDVRGTMKALKRGRALWYGPDQDYGLNQGLFVPFFNIQAATVYATARFAEKTGAAVVPFSHIRLPGSQGYKITIYPALEDFPVGDDLVDTTRINRIVEEFIMLQPDQYLWVHRRFKNRPEGEPDLYNLPAKNKRRRESA